MKSKSKLQSKSFKRLASAVSATCLLLSMNPVSNASTIHTSNTIKDLDSYLKNLSQADREMIHQMQDFEGLKISPEVNLNVDTPLNVIVQFKQEPSVVDFKSKQANGLKASVEESIEIVENSHKKFKEQLNGHSKLKQNGSISREYKHAFNGVAMTLPANQVQELLNLDTVNAVWEDTEVSIEPLVENNMESTTSATKTLDNIKQIGASNLHKEGITGKGIKVAVIDTGIDYTHPDLKDVFKGGFDFVNNDSDPMETSYEDWKVSKQPEISPVSGTTYYTSHGTHVSGIIAGTGKNQSEFAITGVAPQVELYGYKVLGPYGSGFSNHILAAIDRAVVDKMDVINLSLGAPVTDPLDPMSVAINNATLAGTVCVISAGNAGAQYSIGRPASSPLAITVGASSSPVTVETSNGVFRSSNETLNLNNMRLMALNYETNINTFKGLSLPIVYVAKGENKDYIGKNVNGKVVLIERGTLSFNEKILNAKANGAKAVIIYNNIPGEDYIPYYAGYTFNYIPTFNIPNHEGTKLVDMLKNSEVNLTLNEFGTVEMEGDKVAKFSSRGPTRRTYDIKPEITAPGVGVFSSVPAYTNGAGHREDYQHAYARYDGTSMASPHVAGAAALILQGHPDYTPEDVKLALMNTADDLKGSYSVYEKGAGRIDISEAVHSTIKVGVKEEVPTLENGQKVLIPSNEGDLSYGPVPESTKSFKDKHIIEIENRSGQDKVFEVKVQFNPIENYSKDAVKNGVSLDIPSEITVKANSSSKVKPKLLLPAEAELGLYEGYIYFTNKEDSSEVYQVPFGLNKLKEGIKEVYLTAKSFNTRRDLNHFYASVTGISWEFNSRMESFDIVLKNADTGEALGLVDAFSGGFNEGLRLGLDYGFNGLYFPFTGNENQPISITKKMASPGKYEIEVVGRNDEGKVFKKSQPIFIDNTLPTLKMNMPGGVYEVDDSGLKIGGTIYDETAEQMKQNGFTIDQSSNKINAVVSQAGSFPMVIDSNGKFEYQRSIQAGKESTTLSLQTFDNAYNGIQNHPDSTYTLVKKGAPYVKLTSDKNDAKYGDTFKITLSEHNIKDLMGGEYTLAYPYQVFEFKGAELTSEFVKAAQAKGLTAKLTAQDLKTDTSNNFLKLVSTLEGATTSSGINENMPMATITFKVKDNPDVYTKWIQQINILTAKAYVLNQAPVTLNNKFGKGINILPTYSVLEAGFLPDGFIPPGFLYIDTTKDYSKIGAEVYMIGEDGKRYDGTIGSNARFSLKGLPLNDQSYELVVKVPGHFVRHTKIDEVVDLYEGQDVGKLKYIYYGPMRAGDVNYDNVIDILDAVYISDKFNTNDRDADINYDGKVDAKDMMFVKKYYGMKNPDVMTQKPAVTKYKGKVLEDILQPLGLN